MERRESLGKGALIAVYIALKPLYLRSSGTVQIGDLFLALVFFYLLLSRRGRFTLGRRPAQYLGLFFGVCIYQILINLIWSAILIKNLMYPSLYYVFNFLASWVFLAVGREIGWKKMCRSVIIGSFAALAIASLGLLLAFGGVRKIGFFNNPNQLGFFGLIMLTAVFLCGDQAGGIMKWSMVAMSIWAILASASKAAFAGALAVAVLYVLISNKDRSVNKLLSRLLALFAVGVVLYLVFYSSNKMVMSSRTLLLLRRRLQNLSSESDSALGQGRGYDRIREAGINILWGMGEGANDRFRTMPGRELHSTYAALLVSYGLLGLGAYFMLFARAVSARRETLGNLATMSGILLYQVTHNGVRNTLVWLLLAIILLKRDRLCSDEPDGAVQLENDAYIAQSDRV